MFEKHIEALYFYLTNKFLTKAFSVVKKDRKSIIFYEFDDISWILIPEHINDFDIDDIKDFKKGNPDRIFFIHKKGFTNIKNKELCRRLTSDDKLLFDEFHNSCSKVDKDQGMVSLEDPVAYGCFVDNKIASVSSLWNWGEELSDIGILTHPDYRYKGYAKSVCETLMSETDKLFIWRCDSDNIGSKKLAESIGFIEVGKNFTLSRIV